ncbi:Dps family protein [Conexibacter sp. DBS9H8]|uniref:Dps family protein n=1 Tax=Conexibacter sp. DBS9H8 TaxID=2937801 RepID=UPI00200C3DFA|nr:DNA starvation/stationary phase protection protein [Conexibacter sp. DBS9H8]
MALETPSAPITASEPLARALQQTLVDQVALHLQAKQAHWNLIGPGFREIHLQLDEITAEARDAADTVAERLRALGHVADGREETVAETTSLPPYPTGEQSVHDTVALIEERIGAAGKAIRSHHDIVDAEDPASADLLHAILLAAEKQAWMLRSAIR